MQMWTGVLWREESMIKVLVVEDDVSHARLIKGIFESYKCVVLEAGNGLSAMRIINDNIPDLIVVDMSLSGIDGTTLTKLFKTSVRTHHVPVIALSAPCTKHEIERFTQAGCDDIIRKPVNEQAIAEAVKKHVQKEEPDILF